MDKLSPPKSVDPLTVLPPELAEIVLEYLSFRQRVNACMVTKQWARFIQSIPNLWTHLNLTGARKKVSNKFVSKAINVAENKLTAATLNNLYDFDRALKALIRTCPLEELTLLKCGLQGQPLTDELSQAKCLKRLTLGNGNTAPNFPTQTSSPSCLQAHRVVPLHPCSWWDGDHRWTNMLESENSIIDLQIS